MSEFARIPTNETGFRLAQAVSFDRWVNSEPIWDSLRNSAERAELLKNIDHEAFLSLLVAANGIIIDQPISETLFTDEVNAAYMADLTTTVDVMPAPEDKLLLLGRVLDTAQNFDDLEEQAVVLGFGINAVHPFKQANGRTARAVYLLFSRDYHYGNPDLIDTLGENGDEAHMLDGNIYTPVIYQILHTRLGTHFLDANGTPSQPKYQPSVKDGRFLDNKWLVDGVITPRRQYDPGQTFDMWTILSDHNLAPIMTHMLIENTTFRSVRDAHKVTKAGNHAFLIDQFLTTANAEEMQTAYDIFRHIKATYIEMLLREFTYSKEESSVHIMAPSKPELGALTPLKLGKQLARNC
jgi:hypothetical protein